MQSVAAVQFGMSDLVIPFLLRRTLGLMSLKGDHTDAGQHVDSKTGILSVINWAS